MLAGPSPSLRMTSAEMDSRLRGNDGVGGGPVPVSRQRFPPPLSRGPACAGMTCPPVTATVAPTPATVLPAPAAAPSAPAVVIPPPVAVLPATPSVIPAEAGIQGGG